MIFRKNDGFTLVELMVTILISTMVTAVAATTILYGLYINNQSAYVQSQQNATRMLITILEDMVSEGSVSEIYRDAGLWEVCAKKEDGKEKGKVLCYFKDNAICAGDGTVLMDNVLASDVEMTGDLLTVHVQTEADLTFSTSIRCRMETDFKDKEKPEDLETDAKADLTGSNIDVVKATTENRTDFLNVLVKERDSKGWITLSNPLTYYSQWYITTAEGEDGLEKWENGDWNPSTAWCACYISWALNQQKNTLYIPQVTFTNEEGKEETLTWVYEDKKKDIWEPYWFADVDKFMAYFQLLHDEKLVEEEGAPQYWVSMRNQPDARPNPGDIIFFDTDLRDTDETTNHVGVVFHVDKKLDASGIDLNPNDDVIYTIEGNSLGKVAIRQYSATNKTILGYGVLPWIPNLETLLVGEWKSNEGDVFSLATDGTGVYTENNKTAVDYVWEYTPAADSYTITAKLGGAENTVAITVRENILSIEWDSKIFTRPLDVNPES